MRRCKKRSLENQWEGKQQTGTSTWLGWYGDGDPCSHPLGLARMLHEGILRVWLPLILSEGLNLNSQKGF